MVKEYIYYVYYITKGRIARNEVEIFDEFIIIRRGLELYVWKEASQSFRMRAFKMVISIRFGISSFDVPLVGIWSPIVPLSIALLHLLSRAFNLFISSVEMSRELIYFVPFH